MIIKPKIRGFICTNAHPQGCAANVAEQIAYIQSQPRVENGPAKVLVLGASTGFGLASRITAAFGCGASTIGVFFEKPPTETKTASAGYYNTAAFDSAAKQAGLYTKSINADAFSDECKQQVIEQIKQDLGKVDLVIYSLAAPRRTDPATGQTYSSVLKPIGKSVTQKSLNTDKEEVGQVTIEPATEEEIAGTVKVMGGEDWELWLDALTKADVLADNCKTIALSYIGDKITWPIYGHAAIGKAKEDLDRAAAEINKELTGVKGEARVAVLKAIMSQASAAIPIMPLYMSILFRVMKEQGTHEGPIEQLYRLYTECLYSDSPRLDDKGRYRVDEKELDPSVQNRVAEIWAEVTTENLNDITDFAGYRAEFARLFGFGLTSVDYDEDVSPVVRADF
ncbi:trans-2-enoyl-CoA reductase family protein [Proteobacteria bacterium 005FR1]|nr:trans-2-enoyl-CoA reductase family protein [Proteobacteria bacterium 005FR1]